MSRPIYESQHDRDNETAVMHALAHVWRCAGERLKPFYEVDAAFEDGKGIRAFAEIKRRHYDMDEMDAMGGVLLSAHKFAAGCALHAATGVPVLFVVAADDGIYWAGVMPARHDGVRMGGRYDRQDKNDREPCVLIKKHRFFRVETLLSKSNKITQKVD